MFRGKTAIVTGASRGIGKAIARELASMRSNIAVVYASNHRAAQETCALCEVQFGVKAKAYCCDVSDDEMVKRTVAAIATDFGGISILVNNAGITRDALTISMTEEEFDSVVDTNLKGAFHMIRHCARYFLRGGEGRIVNISSVSGIIGNAGQCNYAASKAGLIGLTKSVAKEFASRGIRCNAIAPGFIATEMTKELAGEELARCIPLGRLGSPEDVAKAAAYLLTAEYVTGTVLTVDGGITI